jgi:hypothetical protein
MDPYGPNMVPIMVPIWAQYKSHIGPYGPIYGSRMYISKMDGAMITNANTIPINEKTSANPLLSSVEEQKHKHTHTHILSDLAQMRQHMVNYK